MIVSFGWSQPVQEITQISLQSGVIVFLNENGRRSMRHKNMTRSILNAGIRNALPDRVRHVLELDARMGLNPKCMKTDLRLLRRHYSPWLSHTGLLCPLSNLLRLSRL